MAIDTSAFSQPLIEPQNPMALRSAQLQTEANQLNLGNAKQAARDAQAVRDALKNGNGDFDKTRALLMQSGAGPAAIEAITAIDQHIAAADAKRLSQIQTGLAIDQKTAAERSEKAMKVLMADEDSRPAIYEAVKEKDWPPAYDENFLHVIAISKDLNDYTNSAAKRKEEADAAARVLAKDTAEKEVGYATGDLGEFRRLRGAKPNDPKYDEMADYLGYKKKTADAARAPVTTAPPTTRTAKGIMQWNPETKAYDIKAGDLPPTAGQVQQNIPGDFEKTGDDFLTSIPAQWRTTVKKIAHYDEDPTKVASMRGGMREQLMQWVNQVNPAYDSTLFTNRAPTRKAFTTGTQGQQINAINTAIGHIDQITGLADKLQNGGFVPGNQAFNTIRTMFGADQVTNFDTLKDALAGEVASVLSKGGATVSGIAEAKDKIKAASSPKQLAGYVETLIPVMGSKLAAMNYQYHQAMGDEDSFSALSPQSKKILVKHGFDPEHPEIGDSGGGKISVTDPNGKAHEFDTQAQADAFKKLAGIK